VPCAIPGRYLLTALQATAGGNLTFLRDNILYHNDEPLAGGGASSDIWCQIFADVLNAEVRQVKYPVQANARGTAWIAAVGLGDIGFGDVPKLTEIRRVYTPRPEHRPVYDERFEVFTQLYRQLWPVYHRLNPP
jgi:xylulokinase